MSRWPYTPRSGAGNYTAPPRNTSPIDTLLNRLEGVRATGDRQWIAKCPAHDDSSPSLALKEENGIVLCHCFAQCPIEDVVAAIGLELSDLFPPRDGAGELPKRHTFDAKDVFSCIAKEALMVRLYAGDAIDGTLIEADLDRVRLAENRIAESLRYV